MKKSEILSWKIRIMLMRVMGKQRVALASFPRSGNTWLRYIVEEATGTQTGSIYQDRVMPRGSEGIVIKTHDLDSYRYTHAFHLIRNPFDAIESYFHWRRDVAGQDSITWDQHIEESVAYWRAHTRHWIRAKYPVYRVRYEDLHKDVISQSRLLLLWLGYDLSSEQLMTVAEASRLNSMREKSSELGSRFFRRGQVGEGMRQFTQEQKSFVVDTLRDLLVDCGYEELLSER